MKFNTYIRLLNNFYHGVTRGFTRSNTEKERRKKYIKNSVKLREVLHETPWFIFCKRLWYPLPCFWGLDYIKTKK